MAHTTTIKLTIPIDFVHTYMIFQLDEPLYNRLAGILLQKPFINDHLLGLNWKIMYAFILLCSSTSKEKL